MRHVAPRGRARIPRAPWPEFPAPGVAQIARRHREEIIERAAFDGEIAVHIGFANGQTGLARDAPQRLICADVDGRRVRIVANRVQPAVRPAYGERAFTNDGS